MRDRFEAVEIPLKRTKKSQNARRKFFLLPAVILNKPRKRAVSLFIRYVSHIGGCRHFLGVMRLFWRFRLWGGFGWGRRFLWWSGDAHAHQEELKSLAYRFEDAHCLNPFCWFLPDSALEWASQANFYCVGSTCGFNSAGGGCARLSMSSAVGGTGLLALASRMLTCHISSSLRTVRKAGIPVSLIPFATFQ